ncbi:hypothetical protein MLD38_031892 [Melastoma candidum]|uniref:Uncharacterized protein n=1 Tax=Melastoma candidum TaxID=119954 RepID=A0ACB9MR35_9MYRT|nr:hypothetical protein MLD38_031892 [Melastoma candidum]
MATFVLVLGTVVAALFLYKLLGHLNRPRHPLPPGPRPWPIVGNLPHLGAVPHHSIADLAKTYGPLMHLRLGFVDVVVAASASVASQFLKTHDANFSSRPPNSGAKYIAYNYQDLVFAPYGPRWRLLRKISSVHLFSGKALDDFRHVRQGEVGILVGALSRVGAGTANLAQLLNICTINALGLVMLGKRVFGDGTGVQDPKADEFKSMVVEVMVLAGIFNIGDFVPALERFDLQGVAAKMKKLHKRFDNFLAGIVEEHDRSIANGTLKHDDMLSTLIRLRDNPDEEGNRLTNTEIKALLLNMFTAGTDTSSSTVEWAIAELIRHPKIRARLQHLVFFSGSACLSGGTTYWCVCKGGLGDAFLQKALDYACSAGTDCGPMKQTGACYSPNTVRAHWSYAVNSYVYQRKGQAQGLFWLCFPFEY